MKRMTQQEVQEELNQRLLDKKLIDEPLDFTSKSTAEILIIVGEAIKKLEYKLFHKYQKKSSIFLRHIYTLVEKLVQHEKKYLLQFRKDVIDANNEDDW
jgi:hypothetical protein